MKKFFVILLLSLLFFVSDVSAKTEAPVDITLMGITEISDSLEKGYFTSEQLVQMYLERIEEYDSKFNSINQLNANAISDAKRLDEERVSGKVRSKLHGVPILVKCNIDVYGMPTTAGAKALSDNYPKENAYVVQKLIDAGAIVLGSTNMSEFAFSAKDSYSSYGNVKNVFNVKYTPYGSSGGAAVAVSAGFAAVSLGTDTNSSVRLPAAGAGLVGLRPTLGLVSRSGVIPYDIERDTVGVLSKTVDDNALVLSIIGGQDKKDSYTSNSFEKIYNVKESSLEGVVIGVATQFVDGKEGSDGVVGLTDQEISKLTNDSIKKLEEAGAKIVYLNNFANYNYYKYAYSTYAGITMCDNFNEYIKGTTGSIREFQQLVDADGKVQRLSGYAAGCNGEYKTKDYRDNLKGKYRDYVQGFYDEYDLDVVLYPTLKNKVFVIGKGDNNSPGSILGSVIGYPSITVPMGFLSDGFSYGIEFLSEAYNEEVLLKVANGFETVNGNKNIISSLTPSLYKVSQPVSDLVKKYESTYDMTGKDYIKWMNDVRKFFKNYNNLEDLDTEAQVLLDSYPKEFVNLRFLSLELKLEYILIYVIVFILVVILLKKVRRRIKIIQRNLRRMRNKRKRRK
jgi:Asp-tRNA(Asn)/Glu-tRNA(Gln) amidotransferase A subunit family amidase